MSQEYGNQSKSYLSRLQRSALNSFKAFGYEQITVDSNIKNLTIPNGTKYALMIVESDNTTDIVARYLEFGGSGTPVASGTGMPIKDGTVFDITDMQNLAGFQIIEESNNTTLLNVQYYK